MPDGTECKDSMQVASDTCCCPARPRMRRENYKDFALVGLELTR